MAGESARPPMARASVDPGLYREGEVRRRNEMHGRWSLDCDEIPRLTQRFCSLRTLVLEPDGDAVARLTISTTDTGRPAALLDLPLSLDLHRLITITPATALVLDKPSRALVDDARRHVNAARGAKAKSRSGATTTDVLTAVLRPDVCDRSFCYAVWPLTPSDIAALRAGAGLRIAFGVVTSSSADFLAGRSPTMQTTEGTVSSDWLEVAIKSSVQ